MAAASAHMSLGSTVGAETGATEGSDICDPLDAALAGAAFRRCRTKVESELLVCTVICEQLLVETGELTSILCCVRTTAEERMDRLDSALQWAV